MFRAVLLVTTLLAPSAARAADAGEWESSIHLVTMGPGDHLFMRFGHSALMVLKLKKGTKRYESTVYNYGDADFDAPGFAWDFFRGTVKFRVSVVGSLNQMVTTYARLNRTVIHQRLALTDAQVRRVVAALEHDIRPENRYYDYHYLRASCATKIRDLLDRAVGGTIRAQLDRQQDPHSVRHYARLGYAGHVGAEVANDLFMGRLHDGPQSKYFSMYLPERLSTHLRSVMVPDPRGGPKKVPLAEPTQTLFKRRGPPATAGQGRTLIHLGYLWIALVVGLGLYALRGQPDHPRRSGAWLMLWALPLGIAALMMVFGAVVSTVTEGRINELMLCYPVTDVVLIGVAVRWLRNRGTAGRLLRGYALVRLGLVVLALLGHALGVLHQEPRVLVVLALVSAALLVAITRRFPLPERRTAPQLQPLPDLGTLEIRE
jgi:hypothetical protein